MAKGFFRKPLGHLASRSGRGEVEGASLRLKSKKTSCSEYLVYFRRNLVKTPCNNIQILNRSSKETNGIAADIQPKEKKRTNFDEGKHEMMRNKEVDEGKKERPKGKPMMCEEEAVMQEEPTRVRVPIFTARTVPFEVDATPSLTEQFESIQVRDFCHFNIK